MQPIQIINSKRKSFSLDQTKPSPLSSNQKTFFQSHLSKFNSNKWEYHSSNFIRCFTVAASLIPTVCAEKDELFSSFNKNISEENFKNSEIDTNKSILEIVFYCIFSSVTLFIGYKWGKMTRERWIQDLRENQARELQRNLQINEEIQHSNPQMRKIRFDERLEKLRDNLDKLIESSSHLPETDAYFKEQLRTFKKEINNFSHEYMCSISQGLMNDPITLSSGITYDKTSIKEYLNTGKRICLHTKKTLLENKETKLNTNVLIKNLISDKLAGFEKNFKELSKYFDNIQHKSNNSALKKKKLKGKSRKKNSTV